MFVSMLLFTIWALSSSTAFVERYSMSYQPPQPPSEVAGADPWFVTPYTIGTTGYGAEIMLVGLISAIGAKSGDDTSIVKGTEITLFDMDVSFRELLASVRKLR